MKIDILGRKEDFKQMQICAQSIQRVTSLSGVKAEINLTHNFAAFAGASFNPSMTPVIFINGKVEFSGRVPEQRLLQLKITQLRNSGGDLF